METLWKKMSRIYGHKWTSAYGDEPLDEWQSVLVGINGEMMAKGFGLMINSFQSWPPCAVDFRALCLPAPSDYGLTSEDKAFQMAVGNVTEKTPEVVYTLRQMGSEAYKLKRSDDEQEAKRRWSKWYAETVEYVMAGGELPEPEKQLEELRQPADSDIASDEIAKMKALFK